MMRTFRKVLTLVLSLMLVTGLGAVTAFAADPPTDPYGEAYAGTTYSVKVYSGKEGSFGSGTLVFEDNLAYDQEVRVDLDNGIYVDNTLVKSFDFAVKNPGKYYARGFKLAGHDNDETAKAGYRSITYKVSGDRSFSVAYGMKGAMVKYTVHYVDGEGKPLLPSEDFYGMAGDYPVVSYRYVEGYEPDDYNLGKTLTEDETANVFTFTYTKGTATANGGGAAADNGNNAAGGAGNAGGNAGAGNANAGAGAGAGAGNAAGTTIGDNDTPAAAPIVDLDGGDVPTAEPEPAGSTETTRQLSLAKILAGACAVLLIAGGVVAFVLRRRADEYEEDDDEEDDEGADSDGKVGTRSLRYNQ